MIPVPPGSGHYDYEVSADSSFSAASQAIQEHESKLARLDDATVVRVIVDGKGKWSHDAAEHNAKQPQYKILVGRVREWAKKHPA